MPFMLLVNNSHSVVIKIVQFCPFQSIIEYLKNCSKIFLSHYKRIIDLVILIANFIV